VEHFYFSADNHCKGSDLNKGQGIQENREGKDEQRKTHQKNFDRFLWQLRLNFS
jgi:hypothetical protein